MLNRMKPAGLGAAAHDAVDTFVGWSEQSSVVYSKTVYTWSGHALGLTPTEGKPVGAVPG